MSRAILVREYGGPEVLSLEDREVGAPGPGEIRVRHEAVGLNFIDVYHRTGLYPGDLPLVPGSEAAGVVTDIGEGVADIAPGDRIAYSGPVGAYAEERLLPADKAVKLPDAVSFDTAAAVTLKGLTAYYLLFLTHQVKGGDTILFHAAAGGVGLIACQWAKALGATVIGTAGGPEKVALAMAHGCDHVIDYRAEDFVAEVKRLTGDRGVDVVYDSVGKETFERSLDCLRPRGLMVSFGNSTGPVAVPSLGILASKGSLFLTRPTLGHYLPTATELRAAAAKLFAAVADGTIAVRIGQRFALADAAGAHRALEGRKTTGSTLLMP